MKTHDHQCFCTIMYTVVFHPSQVLQLGFRCIRRISKRLFVWDLIERVHEQLLSETPNTGGEGEGISPRQVFLSTVTRINLCNPNIGKDEKVRAGVSVQ